MPGSDTRSMLRRDRHRRVGALVLAATVLPLLWVSWQETVRLHRQVMLAQRSAASYREVGNRFHDRFGGTRRETDSLHRIRLQRSYGTWMMLTFLASTTVAIAGGYAAAPGCTRAQRWATDRWRSWRAGTDEARGGDGPR